MQCMFRPAGITFLHKDLRSSLVKYSCPLQPICLVLWAQEDLLELERGSQHIPQSAPLAFPCTAGDSCCCSMILE